MAAAKSVIGRPAPAFELTLKAGAFELDHLNALLAPLLKEKPSQQTANNDTPPGKSTEGG